MAAPFLCQFRGYGLHMSWIVPILILLAAFVGIGVWRGRQFGDLARRGMPVTGRVVRKFRAENVDISGSRSRRLAFTYTGPDGREYRRAASVTIGKWAEYEEGSAIALICLPDDPGVSAPAWLVELAREALAKKGRL